MTTVVTGGSGGLGRLVVDLLRERGVETIAASRRTGFDLQTGEGVASVLEGAEVVVHAASHPLKYRKVDLDGTRRIIDLVSRRPRPTHLVYISIVGCSRIPFPYYRAKYASELALERSGLPVTVVRATQFHSLVAGLVGAVGRGPVAQVPPLSFQSCDPAWVAGHLADLAMDAPPTGFRRTADLAGPEVISLADAVRLDQPGKRQVALPAIGRLLTSFAAGANLADPGAEIGGSSYRAWRSQQA